MKEKKCIICGRFFKVRCSQKNKKGRYELEQFSTREFYRPPNSKTCSPECSRKLYNKKISKAVVKYQRTPKGKEAHKRAMRRYLHKKFGWYEDTV